jgi:hypothetical protein
MSDAISIGADVGGPEPCLLIKHKVTLYETLARHVSGTHCPCIDAYALVLRIDGSLDSFGKEGFSRLRLARSQRTVTVDIQVPTSVWRPQTDAQAKAYLVKCVGGAIALCVERLVQAKCSVDAECLQQQMNNAFSEFLSPSVG